MGLLIAGVLIGVLVVLILFILIRTILFVPQKQEKVAAEPVSLNQEKIVADMVDKIGRAHV